MTSTLLAALAAPLALQASAPPPPAPEKPATLADLPIEQSTAPRCGIAFALVEEWQAAGDPRGAEWPTLQGTGAREFFVVAMARLIDAQALEREDVRRIVAAEVERHKADDGAAVAAMMPACLALLESSGIKG